MTKYKFSDYQGGRIINFILHNDNCIRELSFLDAIDCIDLINKSHINQHVTISFQWCCLKCYIRHITMLIFPLLPIYYGLNISTVTTYSLLFTLWYSCKCVTNQSLMSKLWIHNVPTLTIDILIFLTSGSSQSYSSLTWFLSCKFDLVV